ncbi:hypothetical protein Tsubulata_001876 [Turnera subulata]|uniref:Aminotransferase-like plant mobile domain-containing protein n=1 Tax=Turnera subulata TaxID=218843 RepID=A0A9Q0F1Z5_9ROSI|nr:hypothetical protein Tsubulata_001876 [Turnera subulata]
MAGSSPPHSFEDLPSTALEHILADASTDDVRRDSFNVVVRYFGRPETLFESWSDTSSAISPALGPEPIQDHHILERNSGDWRRWVTRLTPSCSASWRRWGIFDLVQLSMHVPKLDYPLISAAALFWNAALNLFVFPFGPLTVNLYDLSVLFGLPPHSHEFGSIDPSQSRFSDRFITSWSGQSYSAVMKHITPDPMEDHFKFLIVFFSHFLFCSRGRECTLRFVPLVRQLLETVQPVALGPLVLAAIYRGLFELTQETPGKLQRLASGPYARSFQKADSVAAWRIILVSRDLPTDISVLKDTRTTMEVYHPHFCTAATLVVFLNSGSSASGLRVLSSGGRHGHADSSFLPGDRPFLIFSCIGLLVSILLPWLSSLRLVPFNVYSAPSFSQKWKGSSPAASAPGRAGTSNVHPPASKRPRGPLLQLMGPKTTLCSPVAAGVPSQVEPSIPPSQPAVSPLSSDSSDLSLIRRRGRTQSSPAISLLPLAPGGPTVPTIVLSSRTGTFGTGETAGDEASSFPCNFVPYLASTPCADPSSSLAEDVAGCSGPIDPSVTAPSPFPDVVVIEVGTFPLTSAALDVPLAEGFVGAIHSSSVFVATTTPLLEAPADPVTAGFLGEVEATPSLSPISLNLFPSPSDHPPIAPAALSSGGPSKTSGGLILPPSSTSIGTAIPSSGPTGIITEACSSEPAISRAEDHSPMSIIHPTMVRSTWPVVSEASPSADARSLVATLPWRADDGLIDRVTRTIEKATANAPLGGPGPFPSSAYVDQLRLRQLLERESAKRSRTAKAKAAAILVLQRDYRATLARRARIESDRAFISEKISQLVAELDRLRLDSSSLDQAHQAPILKWRPKKASCEPF